MSETPKEPAVHLAEIEAILAAWDGFKTSLYWRLEEERARLLVEVPHGKAEAARAALAQARGEVKP